MAGGVASLTPLVLCGEGLEVAGVLQRLHLVADAAVQQADEVQAVQLELQGAVQVQQTLSVRHGPSEKRERAGEREERAKTLSNTRVST